MRSTTFAAALFLLVSPAVIEATAPGAHLLARRHTHHPQTHSHHKKGTGLTTRHQTKQCEFPTNAGLVAVTPDEQNAGWAMSPDQPCLPGMYCPYACPPGRLMAQWSPNAKTYSYPASMDGGLYCNEHGMIEKPLKNKPYCYDGVGTVDCKNKAGGNVAICQTVLPGNEAMLIPTDVISARTSVLAVPDTSYWAKTAAHYYLNPPGVSVEEACVWGTKDKPIGNWAPYVAGANQVDSGVTFVTIGWNPIYIEPDVVFRDVVPDWGVRIECEGGECGGLPCYIDPAEHKVNEISQNNPPGAGGANFCVVSVPKGAQATIVVFGKDGEESDEIEIGKPDDHGDKASSSAQQGSSKQPMPKSTPSPKKPTSTVEGPTTTTIKKPMVFSTDSSSSDWANDSTTSAPWSSGSSKTSSLPSPSEASSAYESPSMGHQQLMVNSTEAGSNRAPKTTTFPLTAFKESENGSAKNPLVFSGIFTMLTSGLVAVFVGSF